MADDTEQRLAPQSPRRDISRRSVVVGLIGLMAAEAVAGGITWQTFSLWLHKLFLAFTPPVSTPTPLHPGAILYRYRGHSNGVNAVKWSPDGKRIVSGSDDQTVQVWDATTGRPTLIYRGHTDTVVLAVAWSFDGRHIASGGAPTPPPPPPTDIPTPTPAPPPPTDIPTPTPAPPPPTPNSISSCLTFSPSSLEFSSTIVDGKVSNPAAQAVQITNCGDSGTVSVSDDGAPWLGVSPATENLNAGETSTVSVAVDSTSLPTGTYTATIRFTITEKINPASIEAGSLPVTLTILPPISTTIQVWDAATGHTVFTFLAHKGPVTAVAWSPDGTHIASASDDGTVKVWIPASGAQTFTYKGHAGPVNAVAWSRDGTRIASAGNDKRVQVWDATTGRTLLSYTGHSDVVNSVAWSPDGKQLASASWDKTVRIWDASSGQTLLIYTGYSDVVNSVAWSPDGKHIASGSSDATVRVGNATNGRLVLTYPGHVASVTTVAWSPDGTLIASGSRDTTVQVWKAV